MAKLTQRSFFVKYYSKAFSTLPGLAGGLAEELIVDLGAGESEVLALATKHPSSLVILDDKLARRIAEMKGFRMTGTAGILLRARNRNFIPELKPVIEKLLSLNFRLKPELVKTILELAGEK